MRQALVQEISKAKQALAEFVNAHPDELAFVQNTTTGINCILKSLKYQSGDKVRNRSKHNPF